jgi:hypothetical protein
MNIIISSIHQCKNNLKSTWKLIGTLINRKNIGRTCLTRIVRNGKTYINQFEISEQFNQHSVNVGPKLANSVPNFSDDPPEISFCMSPVFEEYVCRLFSELNANKSSQIFQTK